jgi:lysozyme
LKRRIRSGTHRNAGALLAGVETARAGAAGWSGTPAELVVLFRQISIYTWGRSVDLRPVKEKPLMPNDFSYSDKGLALTQQCEGLRLTAYQDSVGVWTIGYGHTGSDVHPGLTILSEQATELLKNDVETAVAAVNKLVTVQLQQHQFDALVDFVFNLGSQRLAGSTLLRKLNAADYAGAAEQFLVWVRAGNQVLPGLLARRKAERAMFLALDEATQSTSAGS